MHHQSRKNRKNWKTHILVPNLPCDLKLSSIHDIGGVVGCILVILCNTLSHLCPLLSDLLCAPLRTSMCVKLISFSVLSPCVYPLNPVAVCVVICNVQPQARSFPQSIKFILAVWVVHIFTTSEPIFFTMPQVFKTPNWFLM